METTETIASNEQKFTTIHARVEIAQRLKMSVEISVMGFLATVLLREGDTDSELQQFLQETYRLREVNSLQDYLAWYGLVSWLGASPQNQQVYQELAKGFESFEDFYSWLREYLKAPFHSFVVPIERLGQSIQ